MALVRNGEKYKIVSSVNHCVLDVLGGHPANSTSVISYKWIEGPHQIWEITETADKLAFILTTTAKSDMPGKMYALDWSGKHQDRLIVCAKHGKENQQWIFEPIKPNGFLCYIKNRKSNKVLQSNGDRMEVTLNVKDFNNANQRWSLMELDAHPLPVSKIEVKVEKKAELVENKDSLTPAASERVSQQKAKDKSNLLEDGKEGHFNKGKEESMERRNEELRDKTSSIVEEASKSHQNLDKEHTEIKIILQPLTQGNEPIGNVSHSLPESPIPPEKHEKTGKKDKLKIGYVWSEV